jgi:DNA invertase Pin-like site-specific DNA recombinase
MTAAAKITAAHLERTAVVYVRQSSIAQVRDHRESTARQYAQVEEAARLGWEGSRISVIDADLGLSGRTASARSGFKELVGRICVGEVGAILGLEISRLARSSADLQRLLELCALTDTLIIDGDGIYDLGSFNDRLLLGLKGTMSEAELHLLAGRLQGAKLAAAQRGELRFVLPVGYVYDDEGRPVIDPDEECARRSPRCSPPSRRRGRPMGWSRRLLSDVSRLVPTAGFGRARFAGAA